MIGLFFRAVPRPRSERAMPRRLACSAQFLSDLPCHARLSNSRGSSTVSSACRIATGRTMVTCDSCIPCPPKRLGPVMGPNFLYVFSTSASLYLPNQIFLFSLTLWPGSEVPNAEQRRSRPVDGPRAAGCLLRPDFETMALYATQTICWISAAGETITSLGPYEVVG